MTAIEVLIEHCKLKNVTDCVVSQMHTLVPKRIKTENFQAMIVKAEAELKSNSWIPLYDEKGELIRENLPEGNRLSVIMMKGFPEPIINKIPDNRFQQHLESNVYLHYLPELPEGMK